MTLEAEVGLVEDHIPRRLVSVMGLMTELTPLFKGFVNHLPLDRLLVALETWRDRGRDDGPLCQNKESKYYKRPSFKFHFITNGSAIYHKTAPITTAP